MLLGSLAAGLYALYGASALPFYPHGWPVLLALLTAALTAFRPRVGLAVALTVPVLPLGNLAQGLAAVYGVAAIAWLACWLRRPREALALVIGPLLAPFGGLGLLPLALERVPGRIRRAALAGVGVLAAGLVSGLTSRALPFSGDPAPHRLAVDGANHPLPVVSALQHALAAEPALLRQAAVLAAAAAVLPLLRGRNPWWIAAYGAAVLAVALPGSTLAALPLVASVWVTCTTLALRGERIPWRTVVTRARIPVGATEPAS